MKQRHYLIIVLLALAGPLALRRDVSPVSSGPQRAAYIDRQVQALRADSRDSVAALGDVPLYTIEAAVNPSTGSIQAVSQVVYTNHTGVSLPDLVFRLLPNARSIYGGGTLTVDSVSRGDEQVTVQLEEEGTVMRVPLEPPLPPDQSASVTITFTAQVPTWTNRGYGIFNRARGVTLLAGWYPVLSVYDDGWRAPAIASVGDAMLTETSLYEVALTVPTGFTVVSTGTTVEVTEEGGLDTWRMISGPAREFACAVSDRWTRHTATIGDLSISFYALPATTPNTSAETTLGIIETAISVYMDRFGPYPFTEFDVIEGYISIGGYEFPGMVAVDYGARVARGRRDFEWLVAHETAHQWWYGLVGNDPVSEPWLDEALATYSGALYFEATEGKAVADGVIASWRRTYGTPSSVSLPITSPTSSFAQWSQYSTVVYRHGALFLDALRGELGDERFFALLRRYAEQHRYGRATTADFLTRAQAAADHSLSPLFQRWNMDVKSG
jgi:hypothetical protein